MNIVRAASHKTVPLRAVAKVIHVGRQMATAEARVEDESGKLFGVDTQPGEKWLRARMNAVSA